jgi:hypothetical protein
MKLVTTRVLPFVGFVTIGLLLIIAANCSVQDPTIDKAVEGQAHDDVIEQKTEADVLEQRPEDQPAADNSFCYVCHLNYDGEELALDHERVGVACTECHGQSLDHCNDENNITPPDIMYPKAKINSSCMSCHPRDKIDHVDTHEAVLSSAATQQKQCTDCHGTDHRLSVRTVRWDKATGELLE